MLDGRCEERRRETWEESRIHPNADGERVEIVSFATLSCGLLEPGTWTVRVFQVCQVMSVLVVVSIKAGERRIVVCSGCVRC